MPFSSARIDPIRESLQAVGYGKIDISVIPHGHDMTDFLPFAHGAIFGSPVLTQILERGDVAPEKVEETIVVALRRVFGNEPATVPLQGDHN